LRSARRGQGPRQPGGGKQIAGPRYQPQRNKSHHADTLAQRASPGGASRRSFVEDSRPAGRGDNERERARAAMPTTVQTVEVTPDEVGMRVDRLLEARFPGLAFSHIQRIIRKGELRVNGRRVQPNDRLSPEAKVRIPPLRLDQPKPRMASNEADEKTRAFLKSITLYEDADVLVLDKPMGLAVQGGSGTVRHVDGMIGALQAPDGQRARLVHRLDKDTAGCLLVAKTRFAAAALAKTFRSRAARKIYWALVAGVPKRSWRATRACASRATARRALVTRSRITLWSRPPRASSPGSRSSR
jgi:23S rRNA pseudouridine955/2504/2580 synthase